MGFSSLSQMRICSVVLKPPIQKEVTELKKELH